MAFEDKKWKRMEHGPIKGSLKDYLANMFDEILAQGYTFKLCIGTDSQRKGKGYKFGTVIVVAMEQNLGKDKYGKVLMQGKGAKVIGCNYFSDKYPKNKDGVKERMMYEVGNSIEVAYEINDLVLDYGVKLEIHIDVNANVMWESNKAMDEAVGYVLGMGYDFKVKPDAWAATKSADRVSRT